MAKEITEVSASTEDQNHCLDWMPWQFNIDFNAEFLVSEALGQ